MGKKGHIIFTYGNHTVDTYLHTVDIILVVTNRHKKGILCLFVICVSYSCIVVKLLCGAHPPHHGAANRQRKLTITLLIMTIVSLLMWLPYAVATFLYFQSILKILSLQESFRLEYSLKILYFMNSLVNPIVYTLRMPEFRKALLLLFNCQQRRNNNIIPLHAL